jgi:hypothetical protein
VLRGQLDSKEVKEPRGLKDPKVVKDLKDLELKGLREIQVPKGSLGLKEFLGLKDLKEIRVPKESSGLRE